MEPKIKQNHFGLQSIKKSLKYFLLGKGTNVILSLLILFTLARSLDEASYAAFVSWQALVVLIGLISTIGIQSTLQRFLAELRSLENNFVVYRLLTIGVLLRYLSALVFVVLLLFCFPKIGQSLSIIGASELFVFFMFIGTLRVTSLTIAQAFDSLLWQKVSQFSQVSANIFRIILLLLVLKYDGLTLKSVVLIELGAELIFFIFLSIGYFLTWKNDQQHSQGDISWWQDNQPRVFRYGASRYLANLSKMMYGGAPNRLLVAQFMSIREVAVFGFADSILNLARRFAPVALMLGFIRPIFVSQYTINKDFAALVKMSDIIFRVNLILLMLLIAVLSVVGEPVLDILSANKYGEVSILLAGLFGLLVVEGFRLNLELLIEITELNSISIISNLIQSMSLLIAIPLFPLIGLWAIVVANVSGTLMACIVCLVQLYKNGYHVSFNKWLNFIVLINVLIAYWAGHLIYQRFNSIVLSSVVIGLVYLISNFLLRPFDRNELAQCKKILTKKDR